MTVFASSGPRPDGPEALEGRDDGRPRSERGGVDGLASPYPIGARLPAVFAEDDLMQRFVRGLDDLMAPLLVDLDCFEAYLSAGLAPEDFVRWLGSWLGSELDHGTAGERMRAAVAAAARLHVKRGTVQGLVEAVALAFGARPEIVESGGASWSAEPLGPYPGRPDPGVVVTLRVPAPATVDRRLLEELVSAARPAHIPFRVDVLGPEGHGGGRGGGSGRGGSGRGGARRGGGDGASEAFPGPPTLTDTVIASVDAPPRQPGVAVELPAEDGGAGRGPSGDSAAAPGAGSAARPAAVPVARRGGSGSAPTGDGGAAGGGTVERTPGAPAANGPVITGNPYRTARSEEPETPGQARGGGRRSAGGARGAGGPAARAGGDGVSDDGAGHEGETARTTEDTDH